MKQIPIRKTDNTLLFNMTQNLTLPHSTTTYNPNFQPINKYNIEKPHHKLNK